MNFVLIDYSEIFFKTIYKTAIPLRRGGKFIQIRNEDTEYSVLSPKELSSFHANIVERFCLQQGIEGGEYTTKRMDKYEISDPEWDIIGGGKWVIDDNEKLVHLFGTSGVYGKFDTHNLKEKIIGTGKFPSYQVKISR